MCMCDRRGSAGTSLCGIISGLSLNNGLGGSNGLIYLKHMLLCGMIIALVLQ